VASQDLREVRSAEIGVHDAGERAMLASRARLVGERADPGGLGDWVLLVVDLGLHLHPPLYRRAGGVGAVVVGPVVDPQHVEGRVIQPQIPEAREVPVVDVGVDHDGTERGAMDCSIASAATSAGLAAGISRSMALLL
jgi:hypothetical protein